MVAPTSPPCAGARRPGLPVRPWRSTPPLHTAVAPRSCVTPRPVKLTGRPEPSDSRRPRARPPAGRLQGLDLVGLDARRPAPPSCRPAQGGDQVAKRGRRHPALLDLMAPPIAPPSRPAWRGERAVGAVFRGARPATGRLRFDGLAGCLRTRGGSSREPCWSSTAAQVRSRLITRAAPRLMGLPTLPPARKPDRRPARDRRRRAAPVVRWLSERRAPLPQKTAAIAAE